VGRVVCHPHHPAKLGGPPGRLGPDSRAADRRPPAQASPAGRTPRQDLPGDEPARGNESTEAPPAAGRERVTAPAPATTPLHILLAEDDEFSARFMEQLLARSGHRVRLTTNGREALSLAQEGVFNLLLLDVHMPELDGFGVVGGIRERD